jgi:Domain of unknown function (DUF4389)
MSQAPTPTPASVPASGYPVHLDVASPFEVQRWRPLVNWLLAIPQLIVLSVLGTIAGVLWIVSFFTVLFTTRMPDGVYRFQAMYLRYTWRVTSFAHFMRNDYPPFTFDTTARDESGDPATVSVEQPAALNRWLPLVKWLLVIPHVIVLALLGIAVSFVILVAFFAVIFTGKWPEGMRGFVVGYLRWTTRVNAYALLLVDPYPPFRLAE